MARPKKEGLDYFPFDVDFFEDEKIEAISGEFGIKGEIVAVKLLCAVYRQGYFALWSDLLKMKILKSAPGISLELLEQIVNRLVKWGFFDKNLFDSVRVLTSEGIQRRYFSVVKRRKGGTEELPYLLGKVSYFDNNGVNVYNNSVNVGNNPQSKVKESKVEIELNKTRVQNADFFSIYFSPTSNLEPIVMQLHSENPATRTVEDFKGLAKLVICEWEQNREGLHQDYTEWAKHLLSCVRIKNRSLKSQNFTRNERTYASGLADADTAQQKRDESYARVMRELLSNPDSGSTEMP